MEIHTDRTGLTTSMQKKRMRKRSQNQKRKSQRRMTSLGVMMTSQRVTTNQRAMHTEMMINWTNPTRRI